ncbi:hypothetical protein [Kitasatospora sp. LaBMicrA B282]|uniref:hypothetical protein n=1 Tax=Kitasatospora sp. LaBMicrA B282 TaxID=3420949 RepID=UPI003D0CC88E
MTATRSDLLALDADTLAALANRGLVKRAAKELAAGAGPVTCVEPDGTLRGRFPDGTATALPPGAPLDGGSCSCAAPGVCRHRVALVLAYQEAGVAPANDAPGTDAPATAETPAAPARPWTPAVVDDEALTAAVGPRALATARRTRDRGYTARLRHPTPADPQAVAELPACTVRFPVPGELGFALTDATAARRGEMVALAVWAFRAAEGRPSVTVGGRPAADAAPAAGAGPGPDAAPASAGPAAAAAGGPDASLDAVLRLVHDLLLDGAVHTGPVALANLRRLGDELTARSLHWPAGAVTELIAQLEAYAARSAAHRPTDHALLLAELTARRRAAAHAGGAARAQVLGLREPAETALRRVRLTALGCRIRGGAAGGGAGVHAELYFAHPGAGNVLLLRRSWPAPADGPPPTGAALAARRLAGHRLDALATANVVSESITRTAARTLTLGRSRVAATSVTPVGAAWADLPEPLLVHDLAAHLRTQDGLPPRLIRPRIAAEAVRVVQLGGVEEVGYDPAEQLLEATVRDAAGNPAVIRAEYHPTCPGALDALAAALSGGGASHLSAVVQRVGGRTVLDPIAVLADGVVTVPDLAKGGGDARPTTVGRPPGPADPLAAALSEALAALAEAAHRGLRHLTAPTHDRLADAADTLARAGLTTAASLVREVAAAARGGDPDAVVAAWADAAIRVAVSSEQHAGRPAV